MYNIVKYECGEEIIYMEDIKGKIMYGVLKIWVL